MEAITPLQKTQRSPESALDVIIVGAGLGGLGAAISLSLAGHSITVLESALEIAEVGAGIQILPNASLILQHWGMTPLLAPFSTRPSCVNMLSWSSGSVISSMSFAQSAAKYPGTYYWDFHRAELHRCLYQRALELGAVVRCDARVSDVICEEGKKAKVVIKGTEVVEADLVVGADGVNSRLREILQGREEEPIKTGDLAYRLLLDTQKMLEDEELRGFVENPQVNYWLGPDMHAVNYVLRGGKLFNMVLLVPDDMPAGASTLEGNVEEMRALFKDWDPRISKLLSLCNSVYKWRLCIRPGMSSWSHPSGTFTMLGDAVHATLPYLASGAGMSLEDAAVLGTCLSRLPPDTPASEGFMRKALGVYERCRKERTDKVVERGNLQQVLYHLHDGPEQEERDRGMIEAGLLEERFTGGGDERESEIGAIGEGKIDALAWRDRGFSEWLLGYRVDEDVEKNWPKEDGEDQDLVQSML